MKQKQNKEVQEGSPGRITKQLTADADKLEILSIWPGSAHGDGDGDGESQEQAPESGGYGFAHLISSLLGGSKGSSRGKYQDQSLNMIFVSSSTLILVSKLRVLDV